MASKVPAYFQALNYTLANEDTALEVSIQPEKLDHVFSVAGSGSRVLPLLSQFPKLLTCVDASRPQLYLCELRFEALRALSHAQYLAFFGYPPKSLSAAERRDVFETLRLSGGARKYFLNYFKQNQWNSFLYDGKWERTVSRLSAVNRKFTGERGAGLFQCLNSLEQAAYLKSEFPHNRFNVVLFLLGNAAVFNALLYRGHFPKKNIPVSFFEFYSKVFDRLFRLGLVRENFFLQLLFFGRLLFAEGCPTECDVALFERAKQAISNTEIRYCEGDLLDEVARVPTKIDFLSFSDVPSYFSGEREQRYLQEVAPHLEPGALVVIRNYLHVPERVDQTGFENVTTVFQDALSREKVQVYDVEVLRRRA